MAKIAIKSEQITPFGGIFPVMEQFSPFSPLQLTQPSVWGANSMVINTAKSSAPSYAFISAAVLALRMSPESTVSPSIRLTDSFLQARPVLVGMSTKNSLSETVIGRVLSAVPVTTVTSLPHAIFFGRALPSWRVAVRLHAVLRRRSSHVCVQESHFL